MGASKREFLRVRTAEANAAKNSAASRASLARNIKIQSKLAKRSLNNAVATMHRSLLALKTQTEKKIKKTNHRVSAYAKQLAKNTKEVSAAMKANVAALSSKIAAAQKAASAAS